MICVPASTCSRRPRRRSAAGRARSASSRRASPRSARRARAPGCAPRARSRHGARLIGPNCLGSRRARSASTRHSRRARSRRGASASRPRAARSVWRSSSAAEGRGLGLSAFVSIGNKADVSSNDLLEWWEDDDATSLVALYVESFGNPAKFARIARRLSRKKPILAMKSGRSAWSARQRVAHGSAGRLRHRGRRPLPPCGRDPRRHARRADRRGRAPLDAAAAARRRGRVLTNAGGLGILCADACEGAGLELPPLADETRRARLREILPVEASVANPVDMLGSATATSYERSLPVVLADPGIDAAIVLFVPPVAVEAADVGRAISKAAAESDGTKPVLASILAAAGAPATLRDATSVPSFAYPEAAAGALGRAAAHATWLRRSAGRVPDLEASTRPPPRISSVGARDRGEHLARARRHPRACSSRTACPWSRSDVAGRPTRPSRPRQEIGYPVVVKLAAAGAHKTELGGVALGLADPEAVRAAATRMGAARARPATHVRDGVELLAGVAHDPVFGPLVAFGPGGTWAELIGGTGFRLAPLTDVDAEELVTTGKAGTLVAGFRGAPRRRRGAPGPRAASLTASPARRADLNPVLGPPAPSSRCGGGGARDPRPCSGRGARRRARRSRRRPADPLSVGSATASTTAAASARRRRSRPRTPRARPWVASGWSWRSSRRPRPQACARQPPGAAAGTALRDRRPGFDPRMPRRGGIA